jgi:hypothetical protein
MPMVGADARVRRGRARLRKAVALALVALALVALLAVGVVAAEWSAAKAEENDSVTCSFGMLRSDVGVLVRDDPVGKVCVYLGGGGRRDRIAPMACVEAKLEFETRGGALLKVRKTPAGFRCVYHDGAGHILRVRDIDDQ